VLVEALVFAVTGSEKKPVGSNACFGTETLPHMAKVLETCVNDGG
jgi:hypothetical protein